MPTSHTTLSLLQRAARDLQNAPAEDDGHEWQSAIRAAVDEAHAPAGAADACTALLDYIADAALDGPGKPTEEDIVREVIDFPPFPVLALSDYGTGGAPLVFGFEDAGIEVCNPFMSTCSRFEVSPAVYGFDVVGLGGNLTAWVRPFTLYGRPVLMMLQNGWDQHDVREGDVAFQVRVILGDLDGPADECAEMMLSRYGSAPDDAGFVISQDVTPGFAEMLQTERIIAAQRAEEDRTLRAEGYVIDEDPAAAGTWRWTNTAAGGAAYGLPDEHHARGAALEHLRSRA